MSVELGLDLGIAGMDPKVRLIGRGALGARNVAELDVVGVDVEVGEQEIGPLLRDLDRQRAVGAEILELEARGGAVGAVIGIARRDA